MSSILYEVNGSVAMIKLNRPEKFNSFNREMALLLQEKLKEAETDENVRAIYITGSGKAFCAGQDLGELIGDNPIDFNLILKEHFNPIVSIMRQLPKPIVCAVNGVAAGAGANIALAADIVVASSEATFIQAFSKIGLIPDSGGTFILPRLIGFQKASALMMLGEKVSGDDAEEIGMIYKCFDEEYFEDESLIIAQKLAAMPTKALALTKQALNQSIENNLQQQLNVEDELQKIAASTDDYKEGVASFIEKRKPVYQGK